MRPSPTSLYGLIVQAPLISHLIASNIRASVFCFLKAVLSSSPHIPVEGVAGHRPHRKVQRDRSADLFHHTAIETHNSKPTNFADLGEGGTPAGRCDASL
ncbi:hypothetical protein BgiMline_034362 [Biomphalaria glabrata]